MFDIYNEYIFIIDKLLKSNNSIGLVNKYPHPLSQNVISIMHASSTDRRC